uniref:Uncharacterized protein n=1 Tax=Sciurus vulgaris TaxID=55149 RepID=A0A8D2AGL5_SCIVU
ILRTITAGVPLTAYLEMLVSTLLVIFVGAKAVHRYYRPDLTVPDIPMLILSPLGIGRGVG